MHTSLLRRGIARLAGSAPAVQSARLAPAAVASVVAPTVACRYSNNSAVLDGLIDAQLADMHATGKYKAERIITSPQEAEITVEGTEGSVLNFCANNYLGLCDDADVMEAAIETTRTRGFGLSSVRFICGTMDLHRDLEKAVAKFHGTEAAILYPSCFDANAGLFEAILGPEDVVISDELNHASIIDGIRLCKAQRRRFKHMDMADLEKNLQEASDTARVKLIATDGVFSMDGDVAPLKEICDLADKYGALVFIDECHATGFFGNTGRGTDEYCDVRGRIDIINSTLGKAMGGATGGYTAASQRVVELLKNKARPYLFSNSLAPAVAGASLKVFDMITNDSSYVERVRNNTHRFRQRMTEAGFEIKGAADHPICPVMLYDAKLASEFADEMLRKGIYVIGFSFPVVPEGQARIRVQLSAAHTLEHVDRAVDAFIEVGKAKGVIA